MSGVTLKEVTKSFDETKVIHGVNLEIPDGELCVFVGPSGCGKSTLLRMIAGLEQVTSGSIEIGSRDVTTADPADRGVAMVFQNYALYPHMTVAENMGFGLKMNGVAKNVVKEKVLTAAKILKLEDYLDRRPKALSGGQRQRIGIARAMAPQPDLIICDEPVSALDVAVQAQVLNLLRDLQSGRGLTYLFISHDLGVVQHMCDQIAVMYLGKIVEFGAARDVYDRPSHPYTQALLSAAPVLNPDLQRCRIVLQGDVPSPMDPPSGCRFRTRWWIAKGICEAEEPSILSHPDTMTNSACHMAGTYQALFNQPPSPPKS